MDTNSFFFLSTKLFSNIGTGVAPMRSFLHHRIYAQGANKNVLFFGCRKRAMDYHYRGEWEQLEREGSLRVFTACSRDQVKYTDHVVHLNHAFSVAMFNWFSSFTRSCLE